MEMSHLAKITRYDLSIDLSRPVEELVELISIVTNTFPGRQEEMLQQLDMKIGEALAEIERSKARADKETEESKKDPARSV